MAAASCTLVDAESLQALYNEAYACVEQGICFDEVGHNEGAKAMYERSLALIEKAEKMKDAKQSELYAKMSRAKEHILQRLVDLRAAGVTTRASEKAAAALYPAVPQESPFDAVSGALMAMGDIRNVEEIFSIPMGVQIFFINGEEVSVPSYPSALKIFKFTDEAAASRTAADGAAPPAFIQVGDWVYPLTPGRSPVLHATYGAYMFPDPTAAATPEHVETKAVGLILPNDIATAQKEQFERLLQELTVVHREDSTPPLTEEEKKRFASRLAQILLSGAEWLSTSVGKGTVFATDAIRHHSTKLKGNLSPSAQPVQINRSLQTSVHYLRRGTKVAVKVSGYLVNKLGQLASATGKYVASHAERRIAKSGGDGTGAALFRDVIEVGGAGVSGFATVWMSLDLAAKVLAKSIAEESVKIVEHKYGVEAGTLCDNATRGALNVGLTAWNIDNLGVKAIAKRTAKEAGLHLLSDLDKKQKQSSASASVDPSGKKS